MSQTRSALFLDFDNIYIGLANTAPEAAERFATEPARWLRWLEEAPPPIEGAAGRRVLVRRCYLNPQSFGRYRPFFLRAGFEVVDTPALTGQGKTSADILIALDLVDTLGHPTPFEEFVLFSGDADFTPVLLRLRKHDRRSTVLTVGPASLAYRAACDLLLDEETFVEQALGLGDGSFQREADRPVEVPGDQREVLERIGERVREMATVVGGVQAAGLPQIYKEFVEFREGENWLGFFSLRRMTEAVVAVTPGLELEEEEEHQWWLRSVEDAEPAPAAAAAPAEAPRAAVDHDAVRAFLERAVRASPEPVDLATLAHRLVGEQGEAVRDAWRAVGSFKRFVEGLGLEGLRVSTAMPGFLYDPERHPEPEEPERHDELAERHPELAEFARWISNLTDLPYLPPEHYAVVLRETAREVEENGFHLTQTSKAVRDRANGKEVPVARSHVSFILKGIAFSGHPLGPDDEQTPEALGEALLGNAVELCRRAQMELTEEERAKLRRWLLGGLEDGGAGAAEERASSAEVAEEPPAVEQTARPAGESPTPAE